MLNFSKFKPESQAVPGKVKHLNIIVSGRVQGVGFRYSALRAANAFGIKGFVRNQGDGSVYIEAEADATQLELFLDWCRRGPGHSRVDRVTHSESTLQGFPEFRILH